MKSVIGPHTPHYGIYTNRRKTPFGIYEEDREILSIPDPSSFALMYGTERRTDPPPSLDDEDLSDLPYQTGQLSIHQFKHW